MHWVTYEPRWAAQWDALIAKAPSATFLHSRKFLSYHGNRFSDRSALLVSADDVVGAVFPAALNPADAHEVVSHPGATYGGLIAAEDLKGGGVLEALRGLCAFYGQQGLGRMLYKAVPYPYHVEPAQEDLYAWFRMGARRTRCDLSAAVDTTRPWVWSARRRRALGKAERAGVVVQAAQAPDPLWPVLEDNLGERHGVEPVHSLEEMRLLLSLFPGHIEVVLGMIGDACVAGTVLFKTRTVVHAQYMASTPAGRKLGAMDRVLAYCLEQTRMQGIRFFDFGISTEQGGTKLNEGLYQFKSEFGASGVVHEFYHMNLGVSPESEEVSCR